MQPTDIGIDLGTTNTLIYVTKKGIVLNEPSVVVVDKNTNKVIATGQNAYKMLGKTPSNIRAIYPFKNGIITDVEIAEEMLTDFIKKTKANNLLIKPRVLISCSRELTTLEKEIIKDIISKIGARKVDIESAVKTSALGIGMNISNPIANMIIDIGGGTTDIAILSLNDIVKSKSVKIAGNTFDEDIIKYIRENHKVLIGKRTAEDLKINYADVYKNCNQNIEIKGKDLVSGLPTTIYINKNELKCALKESINKIINEIINILEKTPPDLSADIVEKGMVITGGSSRLQGLLELIKLKTKVPTFIAEYPLISAIEGTGILLQKKLNKDQ